MGRAALKIEIDSAREKTAEFIRFLDSLAGVKPGDLPQNDTRALAEAEAWLIKYSKTLNTSKYINPRHLEVAQDYVKNLAEITHKAKMGIICYILDNFTEPGKEQFKNYNAYADAEGAWCRYEKFIKRHRVEQFGLEKMQALIDRTNDPKLLVSVFFSFFSGSAIEKFHAIEDAMHVLSELLIHTPRSGLSSKTPYQKAREDRDKYINSLKEERDNPFFSNYDFEGLFSKLGSGNIQEKKYGEKLLEQLWNNYIDEKHERTATTDNRHHKNLIALWGEMRQRFYCAKSADEKVLALKPFRKLWCSFIPSRFYDEVKELILKGIVDDSGTVRYRTVRIIDSVAFEIYEYSPDNFKNLLEAIKNSRDTYIRENKLAVSRKVHSQNIKDKTIRSLTQGLEFLEYYAMRRKVI